MQQWDYSTLITPVGDMQQMANDLAAAGAEGFELVSTLPMMMQPPPPARLNGRGVLEAVNIQQAPVPCVAFFFKRPKAPVDANPYNLAPGEELT